MFDLDSYLNDLISNCRTDLISIRRFPSCLPGAKRLFCVWNDSRKKNPLSPDGIQVRLPIIMTENRIEIKQADRNNFCETSMDLFDRFQEVQNVWRIENGRLVL